MYDGAIFGDIDIDTRVPTFGLIVRLNINLSNKYVRPPKNRTEMYAGRVTLSMRRAPY